MKRFLLCLAFALAAPLARSADTPPRYGIGMEEAPDGIRLAADHHVVAEGLDLCLR